MGDRLLSDYDTPSDGLLSLESGTKLVRACFGFEGTHCCFCLLLSFNPDLSQLIEVSTCACRSSFTKVGIVGSECIVWTFDGREYEDLRNGAGSDRDQNMT
jgi:hypothetical protein